MNGRGNTDPDGTPREHTVDTPDGAVRVRVLGTGPPVLCLHGVSAHGRSWLGVAGRLADRASFWMPDLIGRGASSPRPDLSFGLRDEARRIRQILEALRRSDATEAGSRPIIIAGHSQGAALAMAVATDEPSVTGLLLSNPVTPWTRRPPVLGLLQSGLIRRIAAGMFSPLRGRLATVILRRAAGPGFSVPADIVAAYAEPYADRRRAENLMALLRDWRPSEHTTPVVHGLKATRVVAGRFDPRIEVESAERLARELDARFTLVPDGGHVLPEQHPDLLARELSVVLDELAADTGLCERT